MVVKTKKRICTICARGGSKGVPGKNIKIVGGLPLLAWSIKQARDCGLFDVLAVSSDSTEILEIAKFYEVDVLVERPSEMASDHAGKIGSIQHCFLVAEAFLGSRATTVVDLDATSPLRSVEDIIGAVKLLEEQNSSNVITGSEARRSPYFNLVEKNESGSVELAKKLSTASIVRRQDAPKCYDMNASIYVWGRDVLKSDPKVFYSDTLLYEMPDTRSVDIDSELDLIIVEELMKRRSDFQHLGT